MHHVVKQLLGSNVIGCLLAIHFLNFVSGWFVHVTLLRLKYHCGFDVENIRLVCFFSPIWCKHYGSVLHCIHSPMIGTNNVANVMIIFPKGMAYIP